LSIGSNPSFRFANSDSTQNVRSLTGTDFTWDSLVMPSRSDSFRVIAKP
jgi:hypothetical protein